MPTINMTRALRIGNETGISGAEVDVLDNASTLDQAISASTEEEVTEAFQIYDLQAISMRCDQAVGVQILETRFALTSSTDAGPGIEGVLVCAADVTQEIFAGDAVRIEDTVGNDGTYIVESVAFAVTSTITFVTGQELPGTEAVIGTVSRVANHMRLGYGYALTSSTAVGGVLVLAGNLTDKFAAGEWLEIQGTVGNDGIFEIATVTEALGVTTITVNQFPGGAAALPSTEGVVGGIVRSLPSIMLAANSPYLWSIDGGLQNPFIHPHQDFETVALWNVDRGNVVAFMVDNTENAVAAQFVGRIGTNSNIF